MKNILMAILACAACGCAQTERVTTAKIRIQVGTNVVDITQPKDTTIKKMVIDPVKGTLTLEGYASVGNAGAIEAAKAQAESQERLLIRGLELGGQLGATAAKAYGVPTDSLHPQSAPAGMKWRIGTNGIPELAPRDDNAGGVSYLLNQ